MKKNIFNSIKKQFVVLVLISISLSSLFTSCIPQDEDNLFTFTDEMLGQYLKRDTANFSEFYRLLDTVKVSGLINSYGKYTCFAPTNKAMLQFYTEKGKKSLSDFDLDSLKIIAYDHIINGTVIMNTNFINGRLPELTMSDRYISIALTDSGKTWVNYSSLIELKDILVHNGVIHRIDKVLNPSRDGIVLAISKEESFSIFYEALAATGMADSLLKDLDKTYDKTLYTSLINTKQEDNQWFYQDVPDSRKFRYTVLMESNTTMNANGITDLASLKAYAASVYDAVYPDDADITDITNRQNSLNRFIAYHLINKQLSRFTFIDAYDTDHMLKNRDMYEYIETMCPNTLMEIKKERLTGKTNIINFIRETGDYNELSSTFFDKTATNGIYHEVKKMLVYSRNVDNELSSKRLRFDSSSFFPELTNNNMRGARFKQNTTSSMYLDQSLHYSMPRNYIDRIKSSEQTVVGYLCGYSKFQNYEGDEIFLNASPGKLYDFEITTPPIPAGTYEVRFGYLTNGKRGVAQMYFDNIPCGVPLNLNKNAVDNGYEKPGTIPDDMLGYDNDKTMRNNGYMKGPACYKVIVPGWTDGENARYSTSILRRILGTYTFTTAGHHVLTVKGLSGGEFMFDYMEFVPTSVIEFEDIY